LTKSKKIGRPALIRKLVNKAALPPSKKSVGYFTREQLVELSLYLDNVEMVASEIYKLDNHLIGEMPNVSKGTTKEA